MLASRGRVAVVLDSNPPQLPHSGADRQRPARAFPPAAFLIHRSDLPGLKGVAEHPLAARALLTLTPLETLQQQGSARRGQSRAWAQGC